MKISEQSKSHSKKFSFINRLLYSLFPSEKNIEKLIISGKEYRPHYAYLVLKTFQEARRLGYNKFSILEFGCAGGSGLVDLEYMVHRINRFFNYDVQIFGFDAGEGLPPSKDYRDVLYLWQQGDFKMNKEKISKKNLKITKIIIGDVKDTIKDFTSKYNPYRVGLVIQDMDYYSSTKVSLDWFLNLEDSLIFPRTRFYFDDTLFTSENIGELLAIKEFNNENANLKLDKVELEAEFLSRKWKDWIFLGKKFYLLHKFNHIHYNFNSRKEMNLNL
jgi:hypothetical protein